MTKIRNYNKFFKYKKLLMRKNIIKKIYDGKGISKQQYKVRNKLLETYDAILNFYIKNGGCPTIRDLNEPLGISNCVIHKRVETLTNLGLIYKTKAGQIILYDNPSL